MARLIHKTYAFGKDGQKHIFEAFEKAAIMGAPYVVCLDGAFLTTCEAGYEVREEIEDTIKWYGWSRINPNLS